MRIKKTKISGEMLINKYLPADYADSYEGEFTCTKEFTPDDVQVIFWTDFPQWINQLFNLRYFLVKPFGINSVKGDKDAFAHCIRSGESYRSITIPAKSEDETILCMNDVHLIFYFAVKVTNLKNNHKKIQMTTVVNFHNKLGRFYFFLIYPFHHLLIKKMMRHAEKRLCK